MLSRASQHRPGNNEHVLSGKAFAELERAYQSGIVADRISLKYSDESGFVTETITVRSVPRRAAVIEFGNLRAYVTVNLVPVGSG